jgi:hypothetical protein
VAIFYVDTTSSTTDLEWDQISEIDGREYVLRFYWNARAQAWYMDISDQDGSAILNGQRLVVGIAIGPQLVGDARMWPGIMACVAQSQDTSDPGQFDLGGRVLLVYDDLQPIEE